jgi:hypothetical protein
MIHFYAFTSNRPDFIELQVKSFKKYLQEDFSFTIFNNSKFDRMPEYLGIEDMCRKYEIMTFDVLKDEDLIDRCNALEMSCRVFNNQGNYSNPNCAGCYACCFVWEKHISKYQGGNVCLLHPDVFLDQPVTLSDYLKDTPLCFMPQTRPNLGGIHMHDAMVLADMSKLPDPETIFWWGSRVNGILTDIGGQTFFYLKAHPDLNPTLIQQRFTEDDPTTEFHPSEYEVFSIADRPIALHYLRGSNWNYRSEIYHKQKTEWLKKRLSLGVD